MNLTTIPKLENILLVYDLADNSCVLRGYVVVYTGTDIGVLERNKSEDENDTDRRCIDRNNETIYGNRDEVVLVA